MSSRISPSGVAAHIKAKVLADGTKKIVEATISAFGDDAVQQINDRDRFQAHNEDMLAYMHDYTGRKITQVNDTTKRQITDLLARGVDAGDSIDDMAKAVRGKFEEISKGRALNIARTEIATASNFGAHEGYRQAGVPQKEWLSTQDGLVRDTHVTLDGQVVDINDPFMSESGATAMFPGDFGIAEEDVNCRCGVLPVLDDDKHLRIRRVGYWKVFDRKRLPWEKKHKLALAKAFAIQRDAVLAALGA